MEFTHSLIAVLLLAQRASTHFADVTVAIHMDEVGSAVITTSFKDFVARVSALLNLEPGYNNSRLALIFGKSDGRTSVKVSLLDSYTSADFEGVDFQSYFSSASEINLTPDLDPIFERVAESVFNGNRDSSGDRPEAPDFLVTFVQLCTAAQNAKDVVKASLQNGADVAIAASLTGQSFEYNDWGNDGSIVSSIDDLSQKVAASIVRALAQCDYTIEWTACAPLVNTQCSCFRRVEVNVKHAPKRKFCPSSVDRVPCDDKDCPYLSAASPWTLFAWLLIIWLATIFGSIICCPIICLILRCLVNKCAPALIQQFDAMVKESDAQAAAIRRKKMEAAALRRGTKHSRVTTGTPTGGSRKR